MTALADAVLPLIRTRAEVWRWNVADAHGARMASPMIPLESSARMITLSADAIAF